MAVERLEGCVLVVAPHPDDETLGCGGTILRSRDAGQVVDIAFATDGGRSHPRFVDPIELAARRKTEALAAAAALGVNADHVHFLGFEDGRLSASQDAAATALTSLVADLRPNHVLVPSRLDETHDHLAARRAAWSAVQRSGGDAEVLEYPVWFWHHWPWVPLPRTVHPRRLRRAIRSSAQRRLGLQVFGEFQYAVDVAGVLDRKRAALACHETQTTRPDDAPDWPILDDVGGGVFVDRFFQRYEIFRRCHVTVDHGSPRAAPAATGAGSGVVDLARPGPAAECPALPFQDDFAVDVPAGQVVGSNAGPLCRLGVDVEDCISIDRGAMRFEPLDRPGWGRQGIAYGPFDARPGLTVAFHLLNGHNCSQTDPRSADSSPSRWVKAARTRLRRLRRSLRYARIGLSAAGPVERTMSIPSRTLEAHRSKVEIHDNLAVGWLRAAYNDRPDGPRFVVHATRTRNGELRAGDDRPLRLFDGLQNLPMYYVVTLRADGAAFYVASSIPGARGPGSYPQLRPVALTRADVAGTVFAGLQQSILGEVGYRAATRVYGVRVAHLPAWGDAFGTAVCADHAPAPGKAADLGGTWEHQPDGSLRLGLDEPAGLVRVRLEADGSRPSFTLRWREAAPGEGLELSVTKDGATLGFRDGPTVGTLATSAGGALALSGAHELQVLDDGATVSVHLNGALLFDGFVSEGRLAEATGIAMSAVEVDVVDVEAHPRLVPLPSELDMGSPPDLEGSTAVLVDDFFGDAGELDGRWARSLGPGHIDRTGAGSARVRADRDRPNPGRTLYTTPWPDPCFADIEVDITPPGDRRGQGQDCRGGLCLWQDADNYLVVNLWLTDRFPGSSVSSFLRVGGHEGFYDPVWSNVGRAVEPGRTVRLRLRSDGTRYIVDLQGEPVLYRAFSDIYTDADRLDIRRVGLAANWEWGDDTGSTFRDFRGRST